MQGVDAHDMTAPLLGPIGDLAAHAAFYAAAGLQIFPADPRTKAPLTGHGFYDATTDADIVGGWWERWPAALIAHRIDPDHLLLDIDPRHGGLEVWLRVKRWLGDLPVTRVHQSGRGDNGTHFWWQRPAERVSTRGLDEWAKEREIAHQISPGRWSAGIDLLHHTCRYTILPPSPHPDTGKPYQWMDGRGLEVDPAPMPPLLGSLIVATDPEPVTNGHAALVDPDSIADWYSDRTSWTDLLGGHGWRVVGGDGNSDGSRWRHPEATAAHSATISHGLLFVYSTSTPFDSTAGGEPHGYTPFRAMALLDHHGDMAAAARAAREDKDGVRRRDDFAWATTPPGEDDEDDLEEDEATCPLPWPEMPPAAFHGLAGDIIDTLTPHTEADPVGLLASFLAYFGAAVGPGPHFRLSGASHPARLFTLVVGESARARKGSAEAMVRWVMRTADPALANERRATGLNSGEGLIEAVRDPKWGHNKKGEDVLLDAGVDDKRLLLYEPEFAGRLLVAIKRSGSTISSMLRTAWDDGDLQILNSRNPMRATGAHICVIGNTTLDELLLEMSPSDLNGGLMNRFLVVAVRSTLSLPFGGTIDEADIEKLGRQVRERLEQARVRARLEFADECADVWPAAYEALRADCPDGPLGHLTARGPVQVQRLSLLYALIDGADQIGTEHLEAATAFWSHCRAATELILARSAEGHLTGNLDTDRLLQLLVEQPRPWSSRELKVALKWSGSRVVAARSRLERAGMVKTAVIRTKGRPKVVVTVLT